MNNALFSSNDLALGRTVMALERTLMAWIRTSLSLISFGFTIYKFLQAIGGSSGIPIRENAPRNLGLFLVLIGIGSLIGAVFQFRDALKMIRSDMTRVPRRSLSLIVAYCVIAVGVLALLNILFGFGGF